MRVSDDQQRRRLLQLAMLGLVAACLPGCKDGGQSEDDLRRRFLQDLTRIPDLEGDLKSFSVYAKTALIVNVWASWCPPCVVEMPSLEKLSTQFNPRDLRIIGVSVDSDLNLVREFLLRSKLTFPILLDQGNKILRIPTFPSTFLLKRDHTVAQLIVGERDWASEEMVVEVERLLEVRRLSAM